MMGKKPTKKQKQYIRSGRTVVYDERTSRQSLRERGITVRVSGFSAKQENLQGGRHLNAENWLVCKDTPEEMLLKYRYADKYRTLRKKTEGTS